MSTDEDDGIYDDEESYEAEMNRDSKLKRAWRNASFEEKCGFVHCMWREIDDVRDFLGDGGGDPAKIEADFERTHFGPPTSIRSFDGCKVRPELLRAWHYSGCNLSELARKLGVTYQTVNRWRKGTTTPSAEMLEKIRAIKPHWLQEIERKTGRPFELKFAPVSSPPAPEGEQ